MKPIVLSVEQWKTIRTALHEEYPKTTFMIRDKMKRVLGFTVREHRHWVDNPKAEYEWDRGDYVFQIHLDFYSENKRTMFLMKFSEVISGEL